MRFLSAFIGIVLLGAVTVPSEAQRRPGRNQPEPAAEIQPAAAPAEGGGGTEINVKNADIAAVVKIFSKKTKRNYILDEKVKGKVSIYLPGKVTAEESLRILDSVLAFKGFTSVPISENLWKIVPIREARQATIPTITEEPEGEPTAAVVTRVLPLSFVDAEEMRQLVAQLVSPEGLVNAYTGTNSLIIIDSQDNIERIAELIRHLDVPFSDRDMTIVPIQHAEAKEVAETLKEILGEQSAEGSADARGRMGDNAIPGQNIPRTGTIPNNAAGGPSIVPAGGITSATRGREPKIIPDERTNSVILVADPDTTARLQGLIEQLDSKIDLSDAKFYVYRCQFADAEELVTVLSGLIGESSPGETTARALGSSSDRSLGSGNRMGTDSLSRTQQRLDRQRRTPGEARSTSSDRSGGTGAVQLSESIAISADPATNSLIIVASRADYQKVKQLLEQLDIRRRQVLVEAIILEVFVEDNQELDASFITSTGGSDGGVLVKSDFGNDLGRFLSDPRQVSNFSVAAASSGSLTLPGDIVIPTQALLISALKSNNNVNILSAPNILTTDNEEAEILVGENVPFISSTSTSGDNLNNTFNQVDRQDVGITLRLTPQISSGETVHLRVFTEVSSVIPSADSATLGPTTRQRTSETSVLTRDGQMIVIGGLMSDDTGISDSGVPFLKDIPVLGSFFRQSVEVKRKRNLLIFITPHVVQDQYDARERTVEQRESLKDVIHQFNIEPTREEVLNRPQIDAVAEIAPYDGVKPSTIRPPSRSSEPVREEVSLPARSGAVGGNTEPIEIRVKPRLAPESGLGTAAAARAIPAPATTSAAEGAVLLFKVKPGQTIPAGAPLTATGSAGAVALKLPGAGSGEASKFFRPGAEYAYAYGEQKVLLELEAVASSESEARGEFPDIGEIRQLSPYEILNLGKHPWTRTR